MRLMGWHNAAYHLALSVLFRILLERWWLPEGARSIHFYQRLFNFDWALLLCRYSIPGYDLHIRRKGLLHGFRLRLVRVHKINFTVTWSLLLNCVMVRRILMRVVLKMGALIYPWHFRGRRCLKLVVDIITESILRLLLDDLIPHRINKHLWPIIARILFMVDLGEIQCLRSLLFHLRVVPTAGFWVKIVVLPLTR
jgi:hypothetical protein